MDKTLAVLLTYVAAEGMNHPESRKAILHSYGTNGFERAKEAIEILAKDWGFEVPIIERLEQP